MKTLVVGRDGYLYGTEISYYYLSMISCTVSHSVPCEDLKRMALGANVALLIDVTFSSYQGSACHCAAEL